MGVFLRLDLPKNKLVLKIFIQLFHFYCFCILLNFLFSKGNKLVFLILLYLCYLNTRSDHNHIVLFLEAKLGENSIFQRVFLPSSYPAANSFRAKNRKKDGTCFNLSFMKYSLVFLCPIFNYMIIKLR